jgi:hypothetical protein
MSQLRRGILSYQRMGDPHWGQCEPGLMIDSPLGTREMQTFRKLPKRRPKRKAKSGITFGVYGLRG